MTVTMISGATGSQNILSAQKVIDMSDRIYLLEPQAAPLYVLVSRLNKRVAINTTFSWLEDVLNPSWTTLAVSAVSGTSGINTVMTASAAIFNVWDLIKIPSTGEIGLVCAVSSTAITVVRSYMASYSAISAAAAADVVIIGSAFAEGSSNTALCSMSTKVSSVSNYLQIFRKSVEITKSMANTELYKQICSLFW